MHPYRTVSFEWLSQSGETIDGTLNTDFGRAGWLEYPMPPETGSGGYEALDLALGMTVVLTSFKFHPLMQGQWLPLLEINAEFAEPSFQAMTSRGMRGSLKERYPEANLALSPGIDLFRHTPQYYSSFTADGGCSGDACHVSISRTKLDQLIGHEVSALLLAALDVSEPPAISAKPIPLHVSQLLISSMGRAMTGDARKLFCQAKVLEYLAAMVQHTAHRRTGERQRNNSTSDRSHALHAQLLACEGKLPTLDELADQYGRSAKLLNEEFAQEFGLSIYAFVTDHRLTQAHAALLNADVSIKRLAAQLGYSHVSNFTIAFKRKFGYPPGSLRRGRRLADT